MRVTWQRRQNPIQLDAFLHLGTGRFWGRSVALSADGQTLAGTALNVLLVFRRDDDDDDDDSQRDDADASWSLLGNTITFSGSSYNNNNMPPTVTLSADGHVVGVGVDSYVGVHALNNNNNNNQGGYFSTNRWTVRMASQGGITVAVSANGNIVARGGYRGPSRQSYYDKVDQVQVMHYNNETNSWRYWGSRDWINGDAIFGTDFGTALALSDDGTILATGAALDSGSANGGAESGTVTVLQYDLAANEWNVLGQVLEGDQAGDGFGSIVAVSADGTILACGAPARGSKNDRKNGYVRVYKYNGNSRWEQMGHDILAESATAVSGWSMTLSRSDGHVVVVGATRAYNHAGVVRVYKYNAVRNAWQQMGPDLRGREAGEQFGYSVALSNKGDILAVGSSDIDTEIGQIQIYTHE